MIPQLSWEYPEQQLIVLPFPDDFAALRPAPPGLVASAIEAAAVLREIIKARRMSPTDKDQLEFAEAEERGADALEMLEWLFEQGPWGRFCWRLLYDEWSGEDDFLAFCEARFEESKKHG